MVFGIIIIILVSVPDPNQLHAALGLILEAIRAGVGLGLGPRLGMYRLGRN